METEDDFDLDSLLQAQSSDGDDDLDPADLDRSLEEILNAAEDGDPPAAAAQPPSHGKSKTDVGSESASIERFRQEAGKEASVLIPVSVAVPTHEEEQRILAVEIAGGQIAGKSGVPEVQVQEEDFRMNSHSSSSIHDGESNYESDSQSVSEDVSKRFSHLVAPEGSDHLQTRAVGRQSLSSNRTFSGELPSLRVNSSMLKSRMWEFSGKQPPLVSPSPLWPRSHAFSPSFGILNKPGTSRPGAALAAAAAASRQATTPHSSQTKPSRVPSTAEITPTLKRLPLTDPTPSIVKRSEEIENLPSLSRPVDHRQEAAVDYSSSRLQQQDNGAIKLEEGAGGSSSQGTSFLEQSNVFKGDKSGGLRSGQPLLSEIGNDASLNEKSDTRHSDGGGVDLDEDDHFVDDLHEDQANSSDNDDNQHEIVSLVSVEGLEPGEQLLGETGLTRPQTKVSLDRQVYETPASLNPKLKRDVPKPPPSALDIAEEAEKKAASSGLHLEEGAAAQPMRLEGIQRGPPAIGFLHIDSAGPLSQALATTRREDGTGHALAVHSNYIAVGLSKGNVLVAPSKTTPTKLGGATDAKVFSLSNALDKSHAAVTSMSFNIQGDLLLVGHANGSLVLWDVPRAIPKVINTEHSAAIVHTLFLVQDSQAARHPKALSTDCKGLVLLHTIAVVPLFRKFNFTTQCILDGQNTGMVLSLSPLLLDDSFDSSGGSTMLQPAVTAVASAGLGSMVGGMVGGVVAGKSSDTGRKFLHDGASFEEAGGVLVLVTHQTILVIRLTPSLEIYAKLSRPDGIRDGAIPYTAWRRMQTLPGVPIRGSVSVSVSQGARAEPSSKDAQSSAAGQGEVIRNIDDEGDNENQPMLALAWDKRIFVLQLSRGELKVLVVWDLDSVACGVAWLKEQMVVVLTSKEQLCLFTKEGLEVERATIECDEMRRNSAITYHTHILNSFGNPEKTYHNSLAVRAAALYLLGPLQIWRACLLPWQDRIKALQNAGDWMGAFHIAMEVYNGRTIGVIGLPRGLDALREAVIPTLLELLFAYIDEAFTYLSLAFGIPASAIEAPKSGQDTSEAESVNLEAKEQYARVGGVAIEFCVHIRQTDVLFDRVFNKFCLVGQRGTFLELLEPYILKDTLGGLAPEVMQALVEHYSQRGWLQRVEQCVLRMDIASLDFNQVVRLCRDNGLYSALIYLFNKGLDDFKSPLEELLVVAQDMNKSNAQAFGYKMLVYLKYCFSGLAFPPGHGHISPSRLPALRAELLQFLLDDKPIARTRGSSPEVSSFSTTIHPRLSYLLSLDLQATLEVLQCAFPEEGPLGIGKDSSEHQRLLKYSEDSEGADVLKDGLRLLQAVVDALIDVLERVYLRTVDESVTNAHEDSWRLRMSKSDVGYVMELIAQYVALGFAKVSRVILARIVVYLASAEYSNVEFLNGKKDEDARRKENLLVRLLRGVPDSEWDLAQTLELALRAQFWQASACLLAKKGDYVASLDSHLKDRDQPQNTFMFILDVLNPTKGLPEATLSELRKSILTRLPELLQLSSEATVVVMLKHFSKEHKLILLELAPYPTLLFQYLKKIMCARSDCKFSSSTMGDTSILPPGVRNSHPTTNQDGNSDGFEETFEFLNGQESLSELLQSSGLEFTNEMEELYVELLCQFEPKSVLNFLESYENYRLEHCLKLCQDYGITDAAAFLLERVGDVGSALSLVLADMDLHIHGMDISIARLFARRSPVTEDVKKAEKFLKIPEVAATRSVMQVAIQLCQRNTLRLDPVESEALWFRLLDRFVEPLRKLHDARRGFRRRKHQVVDIDVRDIENKVTKGTEGRYKWKVVMISAKAVEVMRRVLVYLMGEIVNGMIGYIPLSVIMEKLLLDNGSHEFGDFKGTILEMLGSYGYEQAILCAAKHVVEDDTFQNISIFKRRSSRAYTPQSSICCVCNHGLDEATSSSTKRSAEGITDRGKAAEKITDMKGTIRSSVATAGLASVMVFFCGHAAHCSCICQDLGTTSVKHDFQSAGCPVCARKRRLLDLLPGKRTEKYMQRT